MADIAVRVQQRLEEVVGPPGVFWDYQNEILPIIAEAMNEAALISGVIQAAQNVTFLLPADTTYVTMPPNAIALLRVQGPTVVQKTDLYSLDQMLPGWQNAGGSAADPKVQQIQFWFPLGVNQFGIYPKLSQPQQVKINYLTYPVTVSPPYTGTEPVLFQQEFIDGLQEYVAHVLRLKEAGYEFQASQTNYQQFLDTMRSLTIFQARHDSLIFTQAMGVKVRANPVEVR